MRSGFLLSLVVVLAAGCSLGDDGRFAGSSSETRVAGYLSRRIEHRPDMRVAIPVRTGPNEEEVLLLPARFPGEPPTDQYVDVYRRSGAMVLGDRLVAVGTRDADGVLVVETLEIRGRSMTYSDAKGVAGAVQEKLDLRSIDRGVKLKVQVGNGRTQIVFIPSLPAAEPADARAQLLQRRLDTLQVCDFVVASGTRDPEGRLVAKKIRIRDP